MTLLEVRMAADDKWEHELLARTPPKRKKA